MFDSFFPDVGVPMHIPVGRGLYHRLDVGVDVRKPASFEGQAAQLLPPGLDQIQPIRLCGHEPQLYLRLGDQRRWRLPREVGTQIVGDQHPLLRGLGLQ
jgi:hypothetical protein